MDLTNSNFDLTASADVPQKLTLLDPRTGEDILSKDGTPVTITILGRDSTIAKKEGKRRSQEMINKSLRSSGKKLSVDEAQEGAISLLAKLTIGWEGLTDNGVSYDFSYDNAVALYSKFVWIREQVDEFITDRQNFMPS